MLFLIPALIPFTFTENEHELEGAKVNAVIAIMLLPGLAPISAMQLPASTSGLATARPAGRVRLAVLLVAPGPVSLALIGWVVLLSTPKVNGALTFTVMKHVPCAGFAGA